MEGVTSEYRKNKGDEVQEGGREVEEGDLEVEG